METLLIRFFPAAPEQSDRLIEWQILDSNLVPLAQAASGTLEDAAEVAPHRKVICLLPGEEILLLNVNIAARSRQQLIKAIPFTLEEDLADDIETLHFAPGARQVDGRQPVAVVSRMRMDALCSDLSATNILPTAILPEPLSVPLPPSGWSLLVEDTRVVLRHAEHKGLALEKDNLNVWLNRLFSEVDVKPELIRIYRCDANPDEPLAFELPVDQQEQHYDTPLKVLSTGLDEKHSINLLQGDYKSDTGVGKLLRPWRFAAVLLGIWLGLQITSATVEFWRMLHEYDGLQVRIEKLFRDTFPEVKRIVNPRVQMEQRLNALIGAQQDTGDTGFLALLNAGGQAIKAFQGIQIDTFNYRQGKLVVSLQANDFQSLERVKQRLQKDGFIADIESADTSGKRVEARLRIERRVG
jgi:general secretion pathway protein L